MKKKKHPLWFGDPFEKMSEIHEDIHRMMRGFWERPFEFRIPEIRIPEMQFRKGFAKVIPIDMAETDREMVVRADLPSFTKDEIRLKVTASTLDIAAHKKKEKIETNKNFYRQERSYGAARRVLTLPQEVKPEEAKAKFEHGVLEIVLPKAHAKKKEKEVRVE